MRNHEVTAVQPLLKEDGTLREPGWSRRMVQVYDRSKIKAAGHPDTVVVLLTNSDDYEDVKLGKDAN